MVTGQEEWSPTLASGTGDWAESAPVPQVEEGDGADHPRESEDKVFHQSLGCGIYGTVKSQLSNNKVQSKDYSPVAHIIERGMEWYYKRLNNVLATTYTMFAQSCHMHHTCDNMNNYCFE